MSHRITIETKSGKTKRGENIYASMKQRWSCSCGAGSPGTGWQSYADAQRESKEHEANPDRKDPS